MNYIKSMRDITSGGKKRVYLLWYGIPERGRQRVETGAEAWSSSAIGSTRVGGIMRPIGVCGGRDGRYSWCDEDLPGW